MFGSQDLMPDKIHNDFAVFVGVTTVFTFLSTVAVILRFTSRLLTLSVKWDDWTCFGALVLAYGSFICIVMAATDAHGGYDIWFYSKATLIKYMQLVLSYNMMYTASVTLSKVSILLFYQRIFQIRKPFRIASWVVGFLVFGFFMSNEFGLIFSFSPVEAQWKVWLPYTTIQIKQFWLATGIINVVLDFIILCLPQPLVWKLKMGWKQRVLLSGVFCLGGVVCIGSILRLNFLTKVNLQNPTATQSVAGTWQVVEMNLSIICACLATYPSLYRHCLQRFSNYSRTYGSDYVDRKPLKGGSSSFGGSTLYAKGTQLDQHPTDKANHASEYAMKDMGSVRVQTDVNVKWDEESQRPPSNVHQVV
ncbi:uncharacterized protein KD926_008431 [Aspergillus affinis]|uniref:uncharacterized protein n=1 Tax=Aspergillus affinis TaxID=1070780 RepID=UPI0022FE6FB3|nr:uncharacterized protein KD926_008431 [Aspergillus affinis]KAI9040230.1 hypothetical protein KD926_008431 [Aspergillus affinis]